MTKQNINFYEALPVFSLAKGEVEWAVGRKMALTPFPLKGD